jgi:hypothetical protein
MASDTGYTVQQNHGADSDSDTAEKLSDDELISQMG